MAGSWTVARATGVAVLLQAYGACQWNPDGLYTAGVVGAFVGRLPDQPPTAIGITVTPLAPGNGITQMRIQAIARSASPDPRECSDLAQQVVDALHGRTDLDLAGVPVPLIRLQSWADLGPDQAGRPEVSLNFYAYSAYATPGFRD